MDETTSSEQSRAAVDPGDQPLNPDEEIVELEKLLATEPDDFQARCRLGELYFSKGRLDDALVEVKKSIEMAEGIRSEMNISPDYEVIDFMRKPILKKLTSLHQLQNVYFMLKGRELKFEKKSLHSA